jgi:hypothetical protein
MDKNDFNTRNIAFGLNLILAPVIYLSGQFLLSRWQALEPDRIWFLSHTLLLIGAGVYVPMIMELSDYLEKFSPLMTKLGVALGVFGAMALFGQFMIDLAVRSIAANQTEMTTAFQHIQSAPAMNWIFYRLAPICFFIGQLVLVLLLTFARQIPRWAGWAAVIRFVGLGLAVSTSNLSVFLLGLAGLALGSVRVGWQILVSTGDQVNGYG